MEVGIQPTAEELLCVVALLWQENDSLRRQLGRCGFHLNFRTFPQEEIRRGREICPTAVFRGHDLLISMES